MINKCTSKTSVIAHANRSTAVFKSVGKNYLLTKIVDIYQ